MQKTEEAAPETESKRNGRFRNERYGRVVQRQLFKRVPKLRILIPLYRIKTAKHHRFDATVAGEGLRRRVKRVGDGVSHMRLRNAFDIRDEISHLAPSETIHRNVRRTEDADFLHRIFLPRNHEADIRSRSDLSVDDSDIADNTAVIVVNRIENQRPERRFGVSLGRADRLHDALQDVIDAGSFLRARKNRVRRVQSYRVLDLLFDRLGMRGREVDFIDDRNDVQALFDRHIRVGQRLRLDSLRCVHDKDRALAGRQRTGHFIPEIHMAGSIDQIEDIGAAVFRRVIHSDRNEFDRYAPFPFEFHGIENLILHPPLVDRPRSLEKTIGERRFSVIDMCDDAEIPNACSFHTFQSLPRKMPSFSASYLHLCFMQRVHIMETHLCKGKRGEKKLDF